MGRNLTFSIDKGLAVNCFYRGACGHLIAVINCTADTASTEMTHVL